MTDNDKAPDREPQSAPVGETPFEGWKDIAAYLNRGVRTVKRWEKEEGLPVRRHQHAARATVYAYPSELDAWKAGRDLPREEPQPMPWRRPVPALALVATLLLALVTVASGPLVHPPAAAADGLVARQVWAGPDVDYLGAVSPDGSTISFVDWSTGDLALRALEAGENRRLTDKGPWSKVVEFAHDSRFSPDGKLLAYSWYKDGAYEVRLAALDNPAPRTLYRNEQYEYLAVHDWSKDSKYLAVTLFSRHDKTSRLALISVADGFAKVLKTLDWRYPANLRFSPGGRYLAYDLPADPDASARDILLLAIDGSEESPLVRHPSNDQVLAWAPDGSSLFFASDRAGRNGLWRLAVDNGRPQGVPELVQPDIGGVVYPLGFERQGVFYYGVEYSTREVYTTSVDLEKGRVTASPAPVSARVLGGNAAPEWSPDGKSVAFLRPKEGNPWLSGPVVIRSLETAQERELSPKLKNFLIRGPGQRLALRWSPDGKQLLTNGEDLKGRQGLFSVDVETGETHPVVLAEDESIRYGCWSPDGKALYFVRGPGRTERLSIVRRNLEDGQEQVLYRSQTQLGGLELSPDGAWLAFLEWGSSPELGDTRELRVVPASGGPVRRLLQLRDANLLKLAGWTPDSRQVLFTRQSEHVRQPSAVLWRISLAGNEPERLELGMNVLDSIRFHPDGVRVVFDSGQSRAEIWAVENLLPPTRAAR